MESVYTYCAIIGGSLVVLQTAMSVVGFGGNELDGLDGVDGVDLDVAPDLDVDLDVDTDVGPVSDASGDTWFVGILSTRAILAALAVFGLTGLALSRQFGPLQTVLSAMFAAAGTMWAVAFVIRSMHKLAADGTVRIEDAIGQPATVYLPIPANNESVGKVTVKVGERTMEYAAVTAGDTLSIGTPVVVVRALGDKLEVTHARETEPEPARSSM